MNRHENCEKEETVCQHPNVKYCPKCKVVYCLDCGKEWSDPVVHYYPNLYYSPYYSPYYGSGIITCSSCITAGT